MCFCVSGYKSCLYVSILNNHSPLNSLTNVRFVNTSMHGVSHPFVAKAFEIFGLPSFIPVREQQVPDPEFPTVKFPNPEEKGVLYAVVSRHMPVAQNALFLSQAQWCVFDVLCGHFSSLLP